MASLEFDNVKALEVSPHKHKDTLFKAGNISLQFNLLDLFSKNYKVKKITVSNAYLNLKVDAKGSENYHFWESSTETKPKIFPSSCKARC